jgi:hypothetical protein
LTSGERQQGVSEAHLVNYSLIATYFVALLPRLALALLAAGHAGDTARYKVAAEAFRSSHLTVDAAFVGVPPLFPVYLALIPNDSVALIVQVAIVSLIAPILGLAAARHFGRNVGTVTAIFAAFEPSLVMWSAFLLTDSFGVLFFAIALEMASRTLRSGSYRAAFGAGLSLGLAWLARAAYVLAAAVIALSCMLSPAHRVARGIVMGLGLALVLAVPATRNLVAIGEPIVYRSPNWELVWLGTMWNEIGRGTIGVDLIVPAGYLTWPPQEQETFARREAVRFVTEDPMRFAVLTMKKVLWFWLPAYPEWSLAHKLFSGGYFLALYALAVVGLVRMRRFVFAWLLVASVVALVIPVALTIVDYDGRYRLPVELCLLPLAAAGADLLARRIWHVMRRSAP